MRFESYNNSCTGSHPNLSNITLQWLLNAIQKKFVCEPERDKRIRVKPSILQKKKKKKKKPLINKPKLACVLLKIIV